LTGKIVVTGAQGWMAREFLEAQFSKGTLDASKLKLLGRSDLKLKLSNGLQLQQYNFLTDLSDIKVEGIVHLAFLTMGKLSGMPITQFQEENNIITNSIKKLVQEKAPQWLMLVSSGAAAIANFGHISTPIDVYGTCKIQEEDILRGICAKSGTNFACGRLWGALGKFMPINRFYAASDFIYTALTENEISIQNPNLVYRRYVDAGEFMSLLYEVAKSGRPIEFNSGGHLLELTDLANKIKFFLKDIKITKPEGSNILEKGYLPPDESYKELANQFEFSLSDLNSLILKTISGHKVQLGI
jgi:nucleoside-diphosphate-sugar epimerase